jgi:hypothetical protein
MAFLEYLAPIRQRIHPADTVAFAGAQYAPVYVLSACRPDWDRFTFPLGLDFSGFVPGG